MKKKLVCLLLACTVPASFLLSGCSANSSDGKIQIELVHYKPEAVDVFEQLEEEFNSTHDYIHLTISSPNDSMTVLRIIRIFWGLAGTSTIRTLLIRTFWRTYRITKGFHRLTRRMWRFWRDWSLCRPTGHTGCLMWQMQRGFCTTALCSRNTDGKFQRPGKS